MRTVLSGQANLPTTDQYWSAGYSSVRQMDWILGRGGDVGGGGGRRGQGREGGV